MAGKKRKRGKKGGGKARRSRYVGVCWNKAAQKWQADIMVAGVAQYLGYFDDEADGARAYDAAVAAQNLHYPRNFPGDSGAKQAKKGAEMRNNISAIPDKGKSRFLGVSWSKQKKKWRVRTTVKGKTEYIGLYDDETAAAWAYDAYVIPNNIDKNLNFPDAPAASGHRPTKQGRSSEEEEERRRRRRRRRSPEEIQAEIRREPGAWFEKLAAEEAVRRAGRGVKTEASSAASSAASLKRIADHLYALSSQ